ncbi:MAG: spoIIIJ-associated protein, partial [Solirubrobacteraceae bacterium]|nr:spoIIIJ-associated protein [Solirubrobacteraceae bacterium]
MSRDTDTTPEDRVRDLVEEIVDALDLDAEVEVEVEGGEINVRVEGEELGAFIGRHGSTIDAVQHLAYKVAGTGDAAGPRVNVDASGYRERRRSVLQRQADEAALRVEQSGRPVALDAMSAIERKVVHEYLKDRG